MNCKLDHMDFVSERVDTCMLNQDLFLETAQQKFEF